MSITNEQIAELWRLKGDTLAGDLAVGIAHDDPNWADAPMLRKIAGPSGIIGDNGHGDEVILASGNPNFPALGAAWAAEAVAMHNALPDLLDEIERLTLERDSWKAEAEMERESNERLRAAVEAAGGLCECGHVKAGHLWYCGYAVECPVDDCKCEAFTPDTQPGEGEGEK